MANFNKNGEFLKNNYEQWKLRYKEVILQPETNHNSKQQYLGTVEIIKQKEWQLHKSRKVSFQAYYFKMSHLLCNMWYVMHITTYTECHVTRGFTCPLKGIWYFKGKYC